VYDTILVPTDGSEHADRAAEHALALAAAFDAEVHVLAVADVRAAAGLFSAGGVDSEFVERIEARAREHATATGDLAGDRAVETAVRRGDPSDVILEYAADVDADLLAMGTHGRSGVDRALAGSVTEHVLRRADIPVLTARTTERSAVGDGYDDVLVPTDGSEWAEAAVDHAVAIAERTNARVHAVSVVDIGDISAAEYAPTRELLDHMRDMAQGATDQVARRANEAGVDVTTGVREGRPSAEILDYAAAEGVDLVAMGTRGHGGIRRLLLGSTTERVVRRAEVPVLAVGPGEGA